MQPVIISQDQHGMRLDRLVAAHMGLSRRCARLLISAGRVRLGSRTCRILTRTVNAGAKLHVIPEHAAEPGHNNAPVPNQPNAPLPQALKEAAPHLQVPQVLHVDRWLMAISKPSGLLSEGDRFGGPCVMDWLGAWLRRQGERPELWLVHRLDAGTSGVLLLARHRGTAAALGEAFKARRAKKQYLALVAGTPSPSHLSLDGSIARVRGTQHGVRADGKSALTHVQVQGVGQKHALVQASPHTGRTHQIRVHLSHAGYPIVGDRLYGGPGYLSDVKHPGATLPVARPMLHAASLTLHHPQTGKPLKLHAPVPSDFAYLQARLGL